MTGAWLPLDRFQASAVLGLLVAVDAGPGLTSQTSSWLLWLCMTHRRWSSKREVPEPAEHHSQSHNTGLAGVVPTKLEGHALRYCSEICNCEI